MSKKLQNIDAVNKMLAGEHKFQNKTTTSFATGLKHKKRLVGEVWEEIDTKTGIQYRYEQKEGYVKKTKLGSETLQSTRDEIHTFANCRKESCTCINPNHLDKKFKKTHDMCYDCVVDYENDLRISGEFKEYAFDRMRTNATEWLKRAEQDVKLLKEAYTKSYTVITNADGAKETIESRMTPEQFAETVEKQFEEYKQKFMEQVTKLETNNEN